MRNCGGRSLLPPPRPLLLINHHLRLHRFRTCSTLELCLMVVSRFSHSSTHRHSCRNNHLGLAAQDPPILHFLGTLVTDPRPRRLLFLLRKQTVNHHTFLRFLLLFLPLLCLRFLRQRLRPQALLPLHLPSQNGGARKTNDRRSAPSLYFKEVNDQHDTRYRYDTRSHLL